jgi:HD-GYP domain-containing protein (c-di-GMP phosphodiesterase class II)
MQALLIHTDKTIGGMVTFILEGNFSVQITYTSYLQGAIDLLATNKEYGLVIYTHQEERHELFKKFIASKTGIPSVLISDKPGQEADRTFDKDLVGAADEQVLVKSICSCLEQQIENGRLKLKPLDDSANGPEEYCRIPPSVLLNASPLDSPVYIRLNEKKFIKIYNQGAEFLKEDAEKYSIQKKVEFLFIKRSDTEAMLNRFGTFLSQLLAKVEKGESLGIDLTLDTTISANEMIQELSQKLGYTDAVKGLINQNVDLAVKSMRDMPSLQQLLDRLNKDKDRYISAHSTITAFIACAMSRSMSFGSDATFQKLTLAAFLHDITLTNHDLAMHRTLDEVKLMGSMYTADEVSAYEQHPKLAAEISRGINPAVAEVDSIILQHHEFCDGTGFPNKISAMQIAPLAALFIIAHEFVLCSIEGRLQSPEMIMELKKKFGQGNFKQVFRQINTAKLLAQA